MLRSLFPEWWKAHWCNLKSWTWYTLISKRRKIEESNWSCSTNSHQHDLFHWHKYSFCYFDWRSLYNRAGQSRRFTSERDNSCLHGYHIKQWKYKIHRLFNKILWKFIENHDIKFLHDGYLGIWTWSIRTIINERTCESKWWSSRYAWVI